MNQNILFVDDDPRILAAIKRQLRKQFYLETALDLFPEWRKGAICKKIMEYHGRRICVALESGKGSMFYFTIVDPTLDRGGTPS